MLQITRICCGLSTIFFCLLSYSQLPAIAQPSDYLCYMTTSSGQVIDLSDSCRSQNSFTVPTPSIDSLFLRDYKQALTQTATNYNIRELLLKQSPESKIQYALAVCNGLKAGLSLTQVQNLQAEQIVKTNINEFTQLSGVINVDIISKLASKYYCPQFS